MRIPANFVTRVLGPGPYSFVEIGVDHGDNAWEFLSQIPINRAWLVDPWSPDTPAGYGHRTQEDWDNLCQSVRDRYAAHPQIEILRMVSEKAAPQVPDNIDIVYIDADHSYEGISTDLRCWLPKVRAGGIICGDDWTNDSVRQAVGEMVGTFQFNLRVGVEHTQWWTVKESHYVT